MISTFEWSPYLPPIWVLLLCAVAVAVALLAAWRGARDFYWRTALFFLLALLMLNPVMLNETRQSLPDKMIIVVDESASQKIAARDVVAENALMVLRQKIKAQGGEEPFVIRTGGDSSARSDGTRLFSSLRDALSGLLLQQISGTVLITDGQVHDVPDNMGVLEKLGPFHTILTGKKDEFDVKLSVVSAPKYGLLNESVNIRIRLDVAGQASSSAKLVQISQDGADQQDIYLSAGEEKDISFTLSHPGQNIFEFSVEKEEAEMSSANNNASVIVNAVRDRLRVLLVSGSPHMGERAWRNLLKSDPGIDLVHFTILRSPNALDPTPSRELSLIVFPVEQLFAAKINDFDLIIFDKYQQYNLLMPYYFTNIRNYIRNGGAFLLAMGSEKIEDSIFKTTLADTLPVVSSGSQILKGDFRASLTAEGRLHPVTADLPDGTDVGPWYTQSPIRKTSGDILMTGKGDQPLLVIDKVDEGRVAVLSSDNIWLWSKGGDSAGPYTELLRNLSHWLMKEPELEDDYIKAEAKGNIITVSQRSVGGDEKRVEMTTPSGSQTDVTLDIKEKGWIRARITAEESGIYSFSNGIKKAFVVVGASQNAEFIDVLTTQDKLKPIVDASGGGMIWFQETPDFDVRSVSENARRFGGDDWLGMKNNKAYIVQSVTTREVFSNTLLLLIILASLLLVWRRESGK